MFRFCSPFLGVLALLALALMDTRSLNAIGVVQKAKRFPVVRVRMLSIFGDKKQEGAFNNGVDFYYPQKVFPVSEGEILFYKDDASLFSKPHPLGNIVVIDHASSKLRTFYAHLSSKHLNVSGGRVSSELPLGFMGDTGKTLRPKLHFSVQDVESSHLLNPFQFLPNFKDNVIPKVVSFVAVINNKIFPLKDKITFYLGENKMALFMVARDLKHFYPPKTSLNSSSSYTIKRLSLKIDGNVVKTIDFSRLIITNQTQQNATGKTFQKTYGPQNSFRMGFFSPTKQSHLFEGECEDWTGNKNTFSLKIFFRKKKLKK